MSDKMIEKLSVKQRKMFVKIFISTIALSTQATFLDGDLLQEKEIDILLSEIHERALKMLGKDPDTFGSTEQILKYVTENY